MNQEQRRIFIVSQGDVVAILPTAMPWLHKMAHWTNGRRTVDDIVRRILNMESVLWITMNNESVPNGALVTTIEAYPKMKMLHVLHCAGEKNQMDGIADEMYEALDAFAKFNHCAGVEFIGRPGWEKHVKPRGYDVKSVSFQKFFEGAPA